MSGTLKSRHRVLVVDDDQTAANSLAFLLGSAGFEAKTAFDGKTALEIAAQFDPDACIVDINMPGMNGYELARHLRARVKETPFILATVTGNYDIEHLDRAVDAGFDLHFTKPADPAAIAEQLEDCLTQK